MQMVSTRITQDGHLVEKKEKMAFRKLFNLASKCEKCLLLIGWISAIIAGMLIPFLFYLFGDVIESYAPDHDPTETREKVRESFFLVLGGGLTMFAAIWLQSYILDHAAWRITAHIKIAYLKAVLQQESAWFDKTNYPEIPSRMNAEC